MSAVTIFVACSSDAEPTAGGNTPTLLPSTTDAEVPAHTPNTPRAETEVARKEVGPQGGQIAGGGATIDVPAGALPANTTIVIKTVDPVAVTMPASTPLAGTVYAFEPDDLQFAKPVTVTIAID
ncbi:MAG: hypothetical protein K0S65_4629, partial [Labilithrix sp.]|nr:hypothetical protein [Labilithrix sp.]